MSYAVRNGWVSAGLILTAAFVSCGCKHSTAPDEPGVPSSYVHTRASWSPDGKTLAYRDESSAHAGVWLVDSSGGNPRRLVSGEGVGFSWSPDSRWVAYSAAGNIYKIRTNGDSLTRLTTGTNDIRPAWSPDGTLIAFVRNGIALVNVVSLTVRQLTTSGNFPSWHPNGHEVVKMDDQLYATGVQYQYYVVAVDTATGDSRSMYGFVSAALAGFGSISPDGSTYVLRVQSATALAQVWVIDLNATTTTKLTDDGGDYPAWSPEGSRIVYTRTAEGDGGLWTMGAGGGSKRRLTSAD